MIWLRRLAIVGPALIAAWSMTAVAVASPWAEVGDEVLRSDIEVLAAVGVVDQIVTTWPIPWSHVSSGLPERADPAWPPYVRKSYRRVRGRLKQETEINRARPDFILRATNKPALIRSFATVARDDLDTRLRIEYMGKTTSGRLSIGLQSEFDLGSGNLTFDDSYLAQAFGNWLFYGGWLDRWWGPGQVSSLALSNNIRPFPTVGFSRLVPRAFETPWLSWLGPWQVHVFGGVFDDDTRFTPNPIVLGFRMEANLFPGFQMGASRVTMVCGSRNALGLANKCSLVSILESIIGTEGSAGTTFLTNISNEVAGIDMRYTGALADQPFTIYGQLSGEDLGQYFFTAFSLMYGLSLWGGLGDGGALWRLTGEYSSTEARRNGDRSGVNQTYNHVRFRNGYRYRGRALGHSLDGDSRLFSLVGTLTDVRGWTYRLAYHHAQVNRDGTSAQNFAPLSSTAEDINVFEAGLTVPLRTGTVEVRFRFQDDDVNTPGSNDFEGAVEALWSIRF